MLVFTYAFSILSNRASSLSISGSTHPHPPNNNARLDIGRRKYRLVAIPPPIVRSDAILPRRPIHRRKCHRALRPVGVLYTRLRLRELQRIGRRGTVGDRYILRLDDTLPPHGCYWLAPG